MFFSRSAYDSRLESRASSHRLPFRARVRVVCYYLCLSFSWVVLIRAWMYNVQSLVCIIVGFGLEVGRLSSQVHTRKG